MLVIRPAEVKDAEGIAHVHVATWRSAYRGIMSDSVLDNLSVQERAERWKSNLSNTSDTNSTTILAEEDGRVIGFEGFGAERSGDDIYKGELYAIYVLKEFQGPGVGRGLFRSTAQGLVGLGFPSMMLWVLVENYPSRAFYERMGGVYLRDKIIEIGGLPLEERAYGWKDLSILVAGKSRE